MRRRRSVVGAIGRFVVAGWAMLNWPGLAARGDSVPMSGVVVDEAGRPVAGAVVILGDTHVAHRGDEAIARAEADAEGRFRLDRPDDLRGRGSFWSPTLWAFAPGHRVGYLEYKRDLPGPDDSVRLAVGPAASTPVAVTLPDGKPASGARVHVTQLHVAAPRPPGPFNELLSGFVDAEGRATIPSVRPEDVAAVDVTVAGMVTQGHYFSPADPSARSIRVHPEATLKVKVEGPDPAALVGWKVTAYSTPGKDARATSTSWVSSTTDDLGLCSHRSFAAGRISWRIEPPAGSPYRAFEPEGVATVAGQVTSVAIPYFRPVKVEGTVVEADTKAPVAGVEVSVMHIGKGRGFNNERGKTDENGRFRLDAVPGQARFSLTGFDLPGDHYFPPGLRHWTDFDVAADAPRHELPTVELRRGTHVDGVAVDDLGKPVANARVVGIWSSAEEGRNPNSLHATTNDRGEFTLHGVAPGATVGASARLDPFATSAVENVEARPGASMTLVLHSRPTFNLSGRVVGPDGQPIAGAPVVVSIRDPEPNTHLIRPFKFPGGVEVRTGADGRFETPKALPEGYTYRFAVKAAGMEPAESEWGAPRGTYADLKLRRSPVFRSVLVRAVDLDGKPVEGVAIADRDPSAVADAPRTDTEGRASVSGLPDAPSILIARKDGYRYLGRVVEPGATEAEFRLARLDQPPLEPLAVAPPAVPRGEERSIALELFGPIWDDHQSGRLGNNFSQGNFQGQDKAGEIMARLDPDRVSSMIENQAIQATPGILGALATRRREDGDLDAARKILGDRADPAVSATALIDEASKGAGREPAASVGERLDRAEALLAAKPEEGQARSLATIALARFHNGQRDKGIELTRRAAKLVAEGADGPFSASNSRTQRAQALAWFDRPAALKLLDECENDQMRQYLRASLAEEFARVDPAESRRLLDDNKDEVNHDWTVARVCASMAARDLPAARDLAATLKGWDNLKAALPAIRAGAVAADDPAQARSLLLEAFNGLARVAGSDAESPDPGAVLLMARLLPMAARVDPDRAPGYLWLTVAVRPDDVPKLQWGGQTVMPRDRERYVERAELARRVARYRPDVARALLAPILPKIAGLDDAKWGLGPEGPRLFRALAATDARLARDAWASLPADPPHPVVPPGSFVSGSRVHQSKFEAQLAIAEALSLPPPMREGSGVNPGYSIGWADAIGGD